MFNRISASGCINGFWALSIVACFGVTAGAGCERDQSSAAPPPNTREALRSEIITSATPTFSPYVLGEGHEGYRNADCGSCHGSFHNSGYRPPNCVACHGTNGAPPPPDNHPNANCTRCHAASHDGLDFKAPFDCASCHQRPASSPTSSCTNTSNYDVVVVGAGGGGLSAGATLARGDLKVLVLEKNPVVGGYMSEYRRGDYRFEVSLHGFDGLDPRYGKNVELLQRLGISERVTPLRAQPSAFHLVVDGKKYDIPADPEQWKAMLVREFPGEKAGIEKFMKEVLDIGGIVGKLMYAETGWFGIPRGLNPLELLKVNRLMNKSFGEYVQGYVKDPLLIRVMGQFVEYTAVPLEQVNAMLGAYMLYTYHFGGAYYFAGGSAAVSRALSNVIQENGGAVRLNELVTQIVVDNGKATEVRTDRGGCYRGKYVVSNANATQTLLELVGEKHLPADYVKKLRDMTPSMTAFLINLGIDQDLSKAFGTAHNYMIAETRTPRPTLPAPVPQECDLDRVGYAVVNYSMTDPTMAPAGKTSLMITIGIGYDCFERWGMDQGYEAYKQLRDQVADHFIAKLEGFFPGVRQHIEVQDVATPITMEKYTLATKGAFNGWAFTRDQSMDKRLAQTTPISNLYLAGAWTSPGGGQSAVLMSGYLAARQILKAEGKAPRN